MAYEKDKSEFYLLGGRNTKASLYDNGVMEMREIVNLNFVTFGALTQRPGTSFYSGATVIGKITGGIEFQKLDGSSYVVVTANTNAYTVIPGAYSSFKSGLLNKSLFSFTVFVDRLFAANGDSFFKWDGTNVRPVGLPAGSNSGFGATGIVGGSLTNGTTGVFLASYGYINDRGYYGPASNGVTVVINGVTFNSILYTGMTLPSNYGISAIEFYRSVNGGGILSGITQMDGGTFASGATYVDTGFPPTTFIQTNAVQFTLIPKYLELFNNQMFMSGFSGFLSTMYWSEVGEPEAVDPEFFNEFRTDDGDRLTGQKAYGGNLMVGKLRSLHRLTGTDPSNFITEEITNQYGSLSHKAMIVWENSFWCLDTKGILEFDGTNTRIVSVQVEDIFKTMNVDAAIDNATAIHYRDMNEIWFAIPTGISTVNDTIVVYDYVAKQWTVYKGITPSVLFLAKQTFNTRIPFYGGYSGQVYYVHPSLTNDSGQNITCMIKTRFEAPQGHSTERMFRRLYTNVSPVVGFTQALTINLRTNYGTVIGATRTMYRDVFQTRVDFGLSARSIQAEMIHASASYPLVLYGYAWESRFQRGV